jgi:hypothetical protein
MANGINIIAWKNWPCLNIDIMTANNTRPLPAGNITAWLAIPLALVILPHISQLPIWLSLLAACVIGCTLTIGRSRSLVLRNWLLWPMVLFCIIGVIAHYRRLFGLDAGVGLLTAMLLLKLLEMRTHRDGMILLTLIYFAAITHFLYSQEIPIALFVIFVVSVNTLALISLNQGRIPIGFLHKMRMVRSLMLAALPIMAALFILFPRIPGPLWGLPQDAHTARSGLSDHMTPGEFSQLALSDEPAFRVVFNNKPPAPEQMYWRTLILWEFDGRTWTTGKTTFNKEPESLLNVASPISYTITIEPNQRRWLFALDVPQTAQSFNNEPMVVTGSRVLRSVKPISSLRQYRTVSYLQYRLQPDLSPADRRRAVRLPPHPQHWLLCKPGVTKLIIRNS